MFKNSFTLKIKLQVTISWKGHSIVKLNFDFAEKNRLMTLLYLIYFTRIYNSTNHFWTTYSMTRKIFCLLISRKIEKKTRFEKSTSYGRINDIKRLILSQRSLPKIQAWIEKHVELIRLKCFKRSYFFTLPQWVYLIENYLQFSLL